MSNYDQRLVAIEGTVKEQDEALFGAWDMKLRQRSPGVIEKQETTAEQMVSLNKIVYWVLAPLVVTNTLSSFGVPIQQTMPILLKLILTAFGH